MKCIFCKTEIDAGNSSKEHIIPKFLGGKKVIYNICCDCNNKFGEDFERILGKNDVFNFIRAYYGLKYRQSGGYVAPSIKLKEGSTFIRANEEGYY